MHPMPATGAVPLGWPGGDHFLGRVGGPGGGKTSTCARTLREWCECSRRSQGNERIGAELKVT